MQIKFNQSELIEKLINNRKFGKINFYLILLEKQLYYITKTNTNLFVIL